MPVKHPLEYNIYPREVDPGSREITLSLKNISQSTLMAMEVQINSFDTYNITITDESDEVITLKPGEIQDLTFQVNANATSKVYISIDGRQNVKSFHWQSASMALKVSNDVAELVGLFALTEPYPPLGTNIRCEAIIKGLALSEGLDLQFWLESPEGRVMELAYTKTSRMNAGEESEYYAEFIPNEEGMYTISAYLFDSLKRISYQVDHVYIKKQMQ